MRRLLLGLGLAMVLAGCASTPDKGSDWQRFSDGFIEDYLRLAPTFAVSQGRHEYDGRLPDWSAAGLKANADFLAASRSRATAFTDAQLTPEQRFERDYLLARIDGDLFWQTDADQPHTNPAFYVDNGLDPGVYVTRPYAAPEVRLRALTKFASGIPAAAAQIRANLGGPLPISFIDYGKAAFQGFADYYLTDAKAGFATVKDAKLQSDYDAAARSASAAMHDLAVWLDGKRSTATQAFALGPARFSRMLWATERVDTPLDRLEALGRADLDRNVAALKDACARYAPSLSIRECVAKVRADKPVGGPVAAARAQLPELKAFVAAHDLVSIPGTEEAKAEEAPPYNRSNSAYISIPGPYERGMPSIYYIAPPDPSWSKQVQDEFVPSKADLLFTSVHEVWPGHFLNFLHANRSRFMFGKLFVGYAFAEGYAHYAEEMMWDAGLGAGDPEAQIGMLTNALLRNVRFLCAIGMHARGMTEDQCRRMFLDAAYYDEGNARQQAARGTYDPAYLNYTLGKLMIRRLRADWTATRGGRTGWKAFHDKLLSYGGPPLPLVRQQMMGGRPEALF